VQTSPAPPGSGGGVLVRPPHQHRFERPLAQCGRHGFRDELLVGCHRHSNRSEIAAAHATHRHRGSPLPSTLENPSTAHPSSQSVTVNISAGRPRVKSRRREITAIDDGLGGEGPHTDLVIPGAANSPFGSFRTHDRVHSVTSNPPRDGQLPRPVVSRNVRAADPRQLPRPDIANHVRTAVNPPSATRELAKYNNGGKRWPLGTRAETGL
jgi:hypothetical protein